MRASLQTVSVFLLMFCCINAQTTTQVNLLQNPKFDTPTRFLDFAILYGLPGWETNLIQHGVGYLYNWRWGFKNVVELDVVFKNAVIKQTLNLSPGTYELKVKYAPKSWACYTSAFSVYWNNQQAAFVQPTDDEIRTLTLTLNAVKGNNTVQIRGEGLADSVGATISEVSLVAKCPTEYVLKRFQDPANNNFTQVLDPQQGWFDRLFNYLLNGDFLKPDPSVVNCLPHWQYNQIQIVDRKTYSKKVVGASVTGFVPVPYDVNVIYLDGNSNKYNYISQTFYLSDRFYTGNNQLLYYYVLFRYAPKPGLSSNLWSNSSVQVTVVNIDKNQTVLNITVTAQQSNTNLTASIDQDDFGTTINKNPYLFKVKRGTYRYNLTLKGIGYGLLVSDVRIQACNQNLVFEFPQFTSCSSSRAAEYFIDGRKYYTS